MRSGCYDPLNPNNIRAVVGGFARQNPKHFHAADGACFGHLFARLIKTPQPALGSNLGF